MAVLGSAAVLWRSSSRLGDPARALRALARAPRCGLGADAGGGGDRAARLVRAVQTEASPEAALACIHEFVSEMRAELDVQRPLPRVYARVSLTTGTAAATLAVAEALGTPPVLLTPALTAFGIGAVGAIVAAQMGRQARARTAALCGDYDRLFAQLERLVAGPGGSADEWKAAALRGGRGLRATVGQGRI